MNQGTLLFTTRLNFTPVHGGTLPWALRHLGRLVFMGALAASATVAGPRARAGQAPLPSICVPMASCTPLVTAALRDPAWRDAACTPDLTLSKGVAPGLPNPPKTSVRLLWDAQYLYVRFTCQSDEIYSPLRGRDAEYYRANVAEVFLDPVGDGRAVMEVEVSPDNGVFDQLLLCTAPVLHSGADGVLDASILEHDCWDFRSWDMLGLRTAAGRWQGASSGREGWLVDLAIPCGVLRRTSHRLFAKDLVLRANFLRYEQPLMAGKGAGRLFEPMNWVPVAAGRPHQSPARMGRLVLVGPRAEAANKSVKDCH